MTTEFREKSNIGAYAALTRFEPGLNMLLSTTYGPQCGWRDVGVEVAFILIVLKSSFPFRLCASVKLSVPTG